jgi:hypothetical protein
MRMSLKIGLRKGAALLLAALAVSGARGEELRSADQGEVKFYLLIGQSNMAGRGEIGEEHASFPDGVFLLNHEGAFETATHPLNQYSTIGKGIEIQKMNIGFGFARAMRRARPDVRLGLVVNARGGSGIQHWTRGTPYYDEALARVRLAQRHGTLGGILWHQGERNSGAPEGYDEKLDQLIQDFRQDLGDATLPFVAGQIIDREDTEAINALIASLPERVPNTGFVSSKGLRARDRWHFDTPSLIRLGEGYAKEVLRLQAGSPVSGADPRSSEEEGR